MKQIITNANVFNSLRQGRSMQVRPGPLTAPHLGVPNR
jgi:hypothetical protein